LECRHAVLAPRRAAAPGVALVGHVQRGGWRGAARAGAFAVAASTALATRPRQSLSVTSSIKPSPEPMAAFAPPGGPSSVSRLGRQLAESAGPTKPRALPCGRRDANFANSAAGKLAAAETPEACRSKMMIEACGLAGAEEADGAIEAATEPSPKDDTQCDRAHSARPHARNAETATRGIQTQGALRLRPWARSERERSDYSASSTFGSRTRTARTTPARLKSSSAATRSSSRGASRRSCGTRC